MTESHDNKTRLFMIPRGAREAELLDKLAQANDDGDNGFHITKADLESRQGLRIIDKLTLDDIYHTVSEVPLLPFFNEARDRLGALHLGRIQRFWGRDDYGWDVDAEASHDIRMHLDRFGETPLPLFVSLTQTGAIEDLNFLPVAGHAAARMARRFARGKDRFAEKLAWHSHERMSLDMNKRLQYDANAALLNRLYTWNPVATEVMFTGVDKIPRGGDLVHKLTALIKFGYSPSEMAKWTATYGNGGLAALAVLSDLLLNNTGKGRKARLKAEHIARKVGELGKKSTLSPLEVTEQAANLFFTPANGRDAFLEVSATLNMDPALSWQIFNALFFSQGKIIEKQDIETAVNDPNGLFERIRPLRDAGWSDAGIYRTVAGIGYLSSERPGAYSGSFARGLGDHLSERGILHLLSDAIGPALIEVLLPYRKTGPYVMTLLKHLWGDKSPVPTADTAVTFSANAALADSFVRAWKEAGVEEDLIEEIFYHILDILERKANIYPKLSNHATWAAQDTTFRRIALTTGITREEVQGRVMDFLKAIVWGEEKTPW